MSVEAAAPVLRLAPTSELGELGTTGELPEIEQSLDVEANEPSGFGAVMVEAVAQSNALGHDAGAQANAFARGLHDDLHGTMITAKEAEISLRMVGSVRNKLLDAFNELWRIHV